MTTVRQCLTLTCLVSVFAAGCSSSNSGTDAGSPADAGGPADSGSTSLYTKYGGASTVSKVVDDAVAGLLADCIESPYFAVVGTTGHDSVARLKSCLRLQFTAVLGGPATYPGVNDEGDHCDDMASIHADLGIPGPVFDEFVTDLAGVLSADGVSAADIATIAPVITGLKTTIVSSTPMTYEACDAGTPDAGSTSLYAKYGGAPTVSKVVDDAVTGLLADCVESPYFSATIGMAGHDSVARLKSCLRLQFTALLGGPATYPGVNDEGDHCEDMSTIHADLGITGPVFDQFITDLAAVLKADGVSDSDIATIAPVVTGYKTEIVSPTPTEYAQCSGQTSLYTKYGGATTVSKVVADAVTGLLGDCEVAPYFTNNLGQPGHDSAARLESCLRLEFTALLGGPAMYPGVNDEGDMCDDMVTAHADIGIPGPIFDQFMMDLAGVLQADGVSSADIATLAPLLTGLKTDIVSSDPVSYNICDGGTPDAGTP